jgi:hypothetical protein
MWEKKVAGMGGRGSGWWWDRYGHWIEEIRRGKQTRRRRAHVEERLIIIPLFVTGVIISRTISIGRASIRKVDGRVEGSAGRHFLCWTFDERRRRWRLCQLKSVGDGARWDRLYVLSSAGKCGRCRARGARDATAREIGKGGVGLVLVRRGDGGDGLVAGAGELHRHVHVHHPLPLADVRPVEVVRSR